GCIRRGPGQSTIYEGPQLRPTLKQGEHMNRRKFGIALGAAIAGLTAGAALAQDEKPKKSKKTKAAKHDCKGQNACKGQGGCSSGDNGCKGKNSCKGKGGCGKNSCTGKDKK